MKNCDRLHRQFRVASSATSEAYERAENRRGVARARRDLVRATTGCFGSSRSREVEEAILSLASSGEKFPGAQPGYRIRNDLLIPRRLRDIRAGSAAFTIGSADSYVSVVSRSLARPAVSGTGSFMYETISGVLRGGRAGGRAEARSLTRRNASRVRKEIARSRGRMQPDARRAKISSRVAKGGPDCQIGYRFGGKLLAVQIARRHVASLLITRPCPAPLFIGVALLIIIRNRGLSFLHRARPSCANNGMIYPGLPPRKSFPFCASHDFRSPIIFLGDRRSGVPDGIVELIVD